MISDKEEITKLKKYNEELYQTGSDISGSMCKVSDSLEERLYRIKVLLGSDSLDKEEAELYINQVSDLQKWITEFESVRVEETEKINRIVSENDSNLISLEKRENESEKNASSESDS